MGFLVEDMRLHETYRRFNARNIKVSTVAFLIRGRRCDGGQVDVDMNRRVTGKPATGALLRYVCPALFVFTMCPGWGSWCVRGSIYLDRGGTAADACVSYLSPWGT